MGVKVTKEGLVINLLRETAKTKTLYIITGMQGTGKTILANILSDALNPIISPTVMSLNDYKIHQYNKYGFTDEYEKGILNNTCEYAFQADVIKKMRKGKTIIVEYSFDKHWNTFFDNEASKYRYRRIVINCNTMFFEKIWWCITTRDLNSDRQDTPLNAEVYLKGKLYIPNKNIGNNKELMNKQYTSGVYTSIDGDFTLTDELLKNSLKITISDTLVGFGKRIWENNTRE